MSQSPDRHPRGLAVARDDTIPLYRQVYEHIRSAITTGQLRPGDRLPSTRALADRFGTARGTIDAAYAILAGEGYVVGRGPAGTLVRPDLDSRAIAGAPSRQLRSALAPPPAVQAPRPFQMGLPALDAFPRKVWSRVVARHVRGLAPADMAYPRSGGVRAVARGHCRIPGDVSRRPLYRCADPDHQRLPGTPSTLSPAFCCNGATRSGSKTPTIRRPARR